MSSEFDQDNLVSIFVFEALDGMKTVGAVLNSSDAGLPTPQHVHGQFITAHRIKGAAALYGYDGIACLCERVEALCEKAVAIPEEHWPLAVGAMRELVQGIETLVQGIGAGGTEDWDVVARCLASSDGLVPVEARVPLSTPVDAACDDASVAPSPDGDSRSCDVAGLESVGGEASAEAMPPIVPAPAAAVASQEYVAPGIDAEVLGYFAPEAEEYLDVIEGVIPSLRADPTDADAIHRLFRAAHTLKGSAYTVDFQVIGDIAAPMEDCLIAVREQRMTVSLELLDSFAHAASVVRRVLQRDPGGIRQLQSDVPALLADLGRFRVWERPTNAEAPAVSLTVEADLGSLGGTARAEAVASADGTSVRQSDEYFVPQLDQRIPSYFDPEAQEYLETLEADLLLLEQDSQNRELLNRIFRTAHTLKGSAYTVGFQAVGDLMHRVEDLMGAARDNRFALMPGHTDVILRALDVVRILMRRDLRTVDVTRQRFAAALSELRSLEQGNRADELIQGQATEGPVQHPGQAPGSLETQGGRDQQPKSKSGQEQEVIRVSYARMEQLMNLVGELVIGRDRLEQRLLALERLSDQVLACKTRLLDSIQSFADKHTFTFQSVPDGPLQPEPARQHGFSDFGALELDKYDDFNILARRIGEVSADITESMAQLNGSIKRTHEDMSQLQHLTRNMRDEIARARLVPIGTPFTRFRRAIREIARASKKEILLVTSGEQTEVDTGVVERLVDPLVHLVRNAVYHGIELPADRIAAGKPAAGTVYLHAELQGNSVVIEVEDDGAGLDLGKIRLKAVKNGLARPDHIQAMSDAEALQYIFAPGFSTADTVGDQAGRGVGLDVVKRAIENMNGHVTVESVPGIGTKFALRIPLTLLITTALVVRAGSERYAITFSNIHEVMLPTVEMLAQSEGRAFLQVGEEPIEMQSLRQVLHEEPSAAIGVTPVVIVRTAEGLLGLAVDELLGRQDIVIKTLGSLKLFEQSCFGGATIDSEGRVVLVIDPARLRVRLPMPFAGEQASAGVACSGNEIHSPAPASGVEAAILLVDDSLSIRKFVGRMLESAGYTVDTAVDGEDGMKKASEKAYRMIITDLEMPKFNGYEVIQALRMRPHTQHTPIVVMTTRAGDKHRRLAIDMGANAYIAKPVNERALLHEVERWMGRVETIHK